MTDQTVIIISEGFAESVLRDLFSFATIAGLIGLGVLVDSAAMQWVGGFLGLMITLLKAAAVVNKMTPMTIAEARAKLDEMEANK